MGPRLIDGYHPDDSGQQGDGHPDLVRGDTGQRGGQLLQRALRTPPLPARKTSLRPFSRHKHCLLLPVFALLIARTERCRNEVNPTASSAPVQPTADQSTCAGDEQTEECRTDNTKRNSAQSNSTNTPPHTEPLTLWSQCRFNCCPRATWQMARTWRAEQKTMR